ncbi:hypothetical protein D3C84_1160870 [compost metagenome]
MAGLEVAYVDAVQAQCRQSRGETARRFAVVFGEHFAQAAGLEQGIGALAPVVEVTGDDHRRVAWQRLKTAQE